MKNNTPTNKLQKLLQSYRGAYAILNNPNYILFDNGKVYSLYLNDYKAVCRAPNGYCYISYKINGKTTRLSVHRIVAEHFVPGYKPGLEVHHIDHNKSNNTASNLAWVSHSMNTIFQKQYHAGLAAARKERKMVEHAELVAAQEVNDAMIAYDRAEQMFACGDYILIGGL